jgi:hypothetical protein
MSVSLSVTTAYLSSLTYTSTSGPAIHGTETAEQKALEVATIKLPNEGRSRPLIVQ